MRVSQVIGLGLLMGFFACQSSSHKTPPRTLQEEVLAERKSASTYQLSMKQSGDWKLYAGARSQPDQLG